MLIKTLKAFTLRDSDSGALTSFAYGRDYSVSDELGTQLITDGLAVEETKITPEGTKSIVANGDYDVTAYAEASVEVPEPSGSETITANGTYDIKNKASVIVNVGTVTLTYDANGGTGSVDAVTAIAGNSVVLSDGTGLVPPDTKTFAGWADSASAEAPNVTSPLTVTENTTIYAVYTA